MTYIPTLISLDEVCELTGLEPVEVCGMQQHREFPIPVAGIEGGPHWLYAEIVEWVSAQVQ
ncbi:hypothetical protein [Trueperella pyogenes]